MTYSTIESVVSSDKALIIQNASGLAVLATMGALADYIQTLITSTDDKISQYSSPSSTGFSVSITNSSESVWLVLTPTAGFAAGTIVLPAVANCVDKQEIMVNCTQSVTTLTTNGNGATVTGAPTTLAANAFFRLRYNAINTTWYRVG